MSDTDRCTFPVYCRGCRARIGFNHGDRPRALYCSDPVCISLDPVGANEERDALIVLFSQHGMTPTQLSELGGVSRPRILQILASR